MYISLLSKCVQVLYQRVITDMLPSEGFVTGIKIFHWQNLNLITWSPPSEALDNHLQSTNCNYASLVSLISWFLSFGGCLDSQSTLNKDVDCWFHFDLSCECFCKIHVAGYPLVYVSLTTLHCHSASAFHLPKYPSLVHRSFGRNEHLQPGMLNYNIAEISVHAWKITCTTVNLPPHR